MRYVIKTLGCKANLYDSQLIEAELQKRGWQASIGAEADLCIVNSCTVTDEADRQSRKLASKLFRDNPEAKVVITGCAAEVDPERLSGTPGIHYVIGNQDKPRLVELILGASQSGRNSVQIVSGDPAGAAPKTPDGPRTQVLGSVAGYEEMTSRHPMDREWPAPESSFMLPPPDLIGNAGRTRAFLKIQEGCNSFCTYCIIPYGRGPNRSLKIPEVLEQVRTLIAQGAREIVITGTNIGDYGTDWAEVPQHAELFEAILGQTPLERLRVSSLDPTEITPRILELMHGNSRFCPHFHVSLQSPHSRILKLMKRKYGFEQVESCLNNIAKLPAPLGGAFVGMDVITGFPGETLEEFEWTKQALSNLPWSRLHVFPYSERSGTPATRLPGSVRNEERVRRCKVLRELSLERLTGVCREALNACRSKNRVLDQILIEGKAQGPDGSSRWIGGYTPNYIRVLFPQEPSTARTELHNQLIQAKPYDLLIDRGTGDVALLSERI